MPQKSRQHIVPRVYLKSFCDPTPPEGHVDGTPFTPSVWIINKDLSGTPRRKAPSNILFKRNFYTLRTDNASEPVIEEWLSWTETKYSKVLNQLKTGVIVSSNELADLFIFIGGLHARTQGQVELWQDQLAELERITRMVERSGTNCEDYSDTQFVDWDEVGKRSIKARAESFAKVLSEGGIYIVKNQSRIPFITSDTPIAHAHVFPETLQSWHVPKNLLRTDADLSARRLVCFCALTPTLGILASHLIGAPGQIRIYETKNPWFVASLARLIVHCADSVLLSHEPNPLPEFVVGEFKESILAAKDIDEIETYIRLTCPTSQFTIKALDVSQDSEGPIGILRFRTSDSKQLNDAASVGFFVECNYQIDGGVQSGMMRNVRFRTVAASEMEESVLYQQL